MNFQIFLVAGTRLYTLPCRSVRLSVGRSVGHIFGFLAVFALLLLPNRPRLDCRVSGLVFFSIEGFSIFFLCLFNGSECSFESNKSNKVSLFLKVVGYFVYVPIFSVYSPWGFFLLFLSALWFSLGLLFSVCFSAFCMLT